jgi:hypothetical protein
MSSEASRRFKCKCGMSFSSEEDLERHIKQFSDASDFKSDGSAQEHGPMT